MKKKGLFSTKEVALCGVLAALCIVTNTFAIETPLVSITFTYLICFMAGHFFGPLVGFTVGTGVLVGVGVLVGFTVGMGVLVGLIVGVGVLVGVGAIVGFIVGTGVLVGVGVGVLIGVKS